jgi:hypothetical protein
VTQPPLLRSGHAVGGQRTATLRAAITSSMQLDVFEVDHPASCAPPDEIAPTWVIFTSATGVNLRLDGIRLRLDQGLGV